MVLLQKYFLILLANYLGTFFGPILGKLSQLTAIKYNPIEIGKLQQNHIQKINKYIIFFLKINPIHACVSKHIYIYSIDFYSYGLRSLSLSLLLLLLLLRCNRERHVCIDRDTLNDQAKPDPFFFL